MEQLGQYLLDLLAVGLIEADNSNHVLPRALDLLLDHEVLSKWWYPRHASSLDRTGPFLPLSFC